MSPLEPEHDGVPERERPFGPEELPPPAPRETTAGRAIGWAGGHARALLTLAVLFQVVVLLGMVGLAVRPLVASDSRTVLLHVGPVDPRDPFRGDYVILDYPEAIATYEFHPGQTVYVALKADPDGRHYRGAGMSATPPAGGGVFLRGTIVRPGRAEFGIEKFFVPEGEGHDYERALGARRVWAEVVVGSDGQARLNRLVVE